MFAGGAEDSDRALATSVVEKRGGVHIRLLHDSFDLASVCQMRGARPNICALTKKKERSSSSSASWLRGPSIAQPLRYPPSPDPTPSLGTGSAVADTSTTRAAFIVTNSAASTRERKASLSSALSAARPRPIHGPSLRANGNNALWPYRRRTPPLLHTRYANKPHSTGSNRDNNLSLPPYASTRSLPSQLNPLCRSAHFADGPPTFGPTRNGGRQRGR